MDPITMAASIVKSGSFALKVYRFVTSEPKALAATLDETYRDFVRDNAEWIQYLAGQQLAAGERMEAIEARLAKVSADPAEERLFNAFAFEAMREAIEERRVMLAAAVAGLALLDGYTVEQKARCERALRVLDPRHVCELYALSRVAGEHFSGEHLDSVDMLRHAVWRVTLSDGEVLVSAGCVWVSPVGVPGGFHGAITIAKAAHLDITPTGRIVLAALKGFVQSRRSPFEVPGREHWQGSRDEATARAFLARQVLTLLALLRPHTSKTTARYSFPTWETRDQLLQPPLAHTPAYLQVEKLDERSAVEIRALRPWEPGRHEDLRLNRRLDEIAIEAHKFDGRDEWYVRIHGPHDVLRWLADDVEASWY